MSEFAIVSYNLSLHFTYSQVKKEDRTKESTVFLVINTFFLSSFVILLSETKINTKNQKYIAVEQLKQGTYNCK